jgi:hypothetical protein
MTINKTIRIDVDQASWRSQPAAFRHRFPPELAALGIEQINLLSALLQVGFLTTPLLNLATPSASWWSVLRYLHIFSNHSDLRLLKDWLDVDFHQKALASDDLGVGISADFLQRKFGYSHFADGRAVAKRLIQLGLVIGSNAGPPKIGQMKTPDYFFFAPGGRIHIVECKGTQAGRPALKQAMADGVAQKRSIMFGRPAHERIYIGQRLVAGVFVRRENQRSETVLVIRDPAPKEALRLHDDISSDDVMEPIFRGDFARVLMASGLTNTALRLGYLDLPAVEATPTGAHQRSRLADAISIDRPLLDTWREGDHDYVGRVVEVPLFKPILAGDRVNSRAILRFGVGKDVLEELRSSDVDTPYFARQYLRLFTGSLERRVEREATYAQINRADIFIARLELVPPR